MSEIVKSEIVKNKFQKAMDEYKALFNEEADEKVKAMLANIFKVSVTKTNDLCIDDIRLDLNIRDCEEDIRYVISPEFIDIYYSKQKKLHIDIEWKFNQALPKIAGISHSRSTNFN